jgi:two-component system response regulator DesR
MKRVLIVGKDKVFPQVLALVLRWHTDLEESVEASSLAEARRVLGNSNHNPDLAIVDLDLANRGGFKLIEELLITNPDIPVLAITLERNVARRDRALRAGAGEVLTMSAPPREIADVAQRLIGE